MNTIFVKNYRSYQLYNVSIQQINTLTILMLQKVYKKINRNLNKEFVFFRKEAECKSFEEYYCSIENIDSGNL